MIGLKLINPINIVLNLDEKTGIIFFGKQVVEMFRVLFKPTGTPQISDQQFAGMQGKKHTDFCEFRMSRCESLQVGLMITKIALNKHPYGLKIP